MSVVTARPAAQVLPTDSACCSSKSAASSSTPPTPEATTPVSPKPKTCCAGKKRKIEEVTPEPATEKPAKRKPQGVVVDGQTYTCAACRSGHRVGLCKHALERPMMPTNPPGRPAAGTKKSGQCDCPKNCNCKKNNCKCPRECACTQEMYLMVYVPDTDESRDGDGDAKEGSWKLGQRVMTDLKGNTLSDEEVARRQAKKQQQKCCKGGKAKQNVLPSDPQPSTAALDRNQLSGVVVLPSTLRSSVSTPQASQSDLLPLADHHCSCGAACACAFCPQHPNNSVSKGLVRQQAMVSSQQQFPNSQDFFHLDASSVQFSPNRSCMGFKPSFAIGHYPMRPGANDFQRAFPAAAGGYMLAYPMWEIEAMQTPAPVSIERPVIQPLPQPESLALPADWTQSNGLFSEDPIFHENHNVMEVGNAFIARNDLGSWNEPFDILDSTQLDFSTTPGPTNPSGYETSSLPLEPPHVPPLAHSTSSSSTNVTAVATPDPALPYHTMDVHTSDHNWLNQDFVDVQGFDPSLFQLPPDRSPLLSRGTDA